MKCLNNDECNEKISSYSVNDLKPLLDLIPEIRENKEFGKIDEELDFNNLQNQTKQNSESINRIEVKIESLEQKKLDKEIFQMVIQALTEIKRH